MKKLFLILVTLTILFSCDEIFPDRCEIENECIVTIINNSDIKDIFAIQVDGCNEIYKYYGLRYSDINNLPDTLFLYNVPAGNSKFMIGSDVYQNPDEIIFVIDSVLCEFNTESCQEYVIELN